MHSNCEIPILCTIATSISGLRTKLVLEEVENKWFKELTPIDISAIYPKSRRKIVDSTIKYSKKTLVGKGQIYPANEGNLGIWKPTQAGIDRATKEGGAWTARYTMKSSLIEDEASSEKICNASMYEQLVRVMVHPSESG